MFSIYTCQMNSDLSETWNLSYLSMNWKPILFNLNGSPQVGSNQMGYLSPTWMVKPKIGHPKCGHPKWDHPKWVNPKLTIPRGLHIFGCHAPRRLSQLWFSHWSHREYKNPPPSIPFHSSKTHSFHPVAALSGAAAILKKVQAGMNYHDTVTFYLHLSKN